MKGIAFAIVWSLACASGGAAAVATDNPNASPLDRAVQASVSTFFRNPCHVGLSMAIVRGSDRRFYDYGSTSRRTAHLPSRSSIYEIASVTKTFTGALAARALVEGKMGLDEDFRTYLEDPFPNLAMNGHPITLRSLATHTSGLPRDIPDTDGLFDKPEYRTLAGKLTRLQKGYGRAKYLAALHRTRLRSEPGDRTFYSNTAIMVIAFGLERVYGEPFQKLMRREILNPLGMRSTGFVVDAAERYRLVSTYSRDGLLMPPLPAAEDAAWGMFSDTEDMAQYIAWQLRTDVPVVARSHAALGRDGEGEKGLIWNIQASTEGPMLWHGGGSFGATALVALFPAVGSGSVLLTNDACMSTEADLKAIALIINKSTMR